jgi:hypothetical protein
LSLRAGTGESAYRISLAVAGFTGADLSIEAKENRLTICGEKQTDDGEKSGNLLYQGIAAYATTRNCLPKPQDRCAGLSTLGQGHVRWPSTPPVR